METAIVFSVVFLGYFLPTFIASARQRPNTGGVFIVNLLTGWLVIGWIVALVMACGTNPPKQPVQPVSRAAQLPWSESPAESPFADYYARNEQR